MSLERKTKATLWGLGLAGVATLAIGSAISAQGDFAAAVRTEVVGMVNGEPLNKEAYNLGAAATSATAIYETLGSMGADFSDTREAAEAACLVAAMNGGVVTEGLASYARGVSSNDPAQFALGQRQCEHVAAALVLSTYEYPDAVA